MYSLLSEIIILTSDNDYGILQRKIRSLFIVFFLNKKLLNFITRITILNV